MNKIILLTGSLVGYAYGMEFFVAAYSGNEYEGFTFINRALGPYESLADVSPVWSKAENWRIAREMTLEEIKGTDLETFLQSLVR